MSQPTPNAAAKVDMQIVLAENSTGEQIEQKLLESLQIENEQALNSQFTLVAKSSNEDIVGGLSASSSYGWLLIKTLWVHHAQRGKGIGSKLMQEAETRAAQIGCHAMWLDTSSPSANDFYKRLGFEEFGKLENGEGQFPEAHRRWFLKKML